MDLTQEMIGFIEKNRLQESQIFILRSDGVCLFEQAGNVASKMENTVLLSLLAGAAAIAESLNKYFEKKMEPLRVSFETSNTGIYLLRIRKSFEVCYLAVTYSGEKNPYRLKLRMRTLALQLEKNEILAKNTVTHKKNFLFQNISESEIEELFSTLGT